jgi:hypothetical protein
MKQLKDILSIGDQVTIDEVIYDCIEGPQYSCEGCTREGAIYNCDGIKCSNNNIILKVYTPKYPVLLVAGESIEILGLKLLIKPEINCCNGCVLNCGISTVLCRQLDCKTNSVIISEEVVE